MLLTEEEAKEKWCPFARLWSNNGTGGGGSGGFNRDYKSTEMMPAGIWCIASHCMAWRWAGYKTAQGPVVQEEPEWKDRVGSGERFGFCGLAGKP